MSPKGFFGGCSYLFLVAEAGRRCPQSFPVCWLALGSAGKHWAALRSSGDPPPEQTKRGATKKVGEPKTKLSSPRMGRFRVCCPYYLVHKALQISYNRPGRRTKQNPPCRVLFGFLHILGLGGRLDRSPELSGVLGSTWELRGPTL